MRFIIATLGCKVNQYESEAMELLLKERGHRPCRAGEAADAVIVNSCAVTAEAVRKARQTVRRLKNDHPSALLAVGGCWSQLDPEGAAALGTEVLFGTGNRKAFVDAVERAVSGARHPVRSIDDPFRRGGFEALPSGAYAGHARAYLKIEEGCDNFCAYCVIPYARGRVLFLPSERCAAEAGRLAEKGYREIVVTGIEISSWGKDLKTSESLIDALEKTAAAVPGVRLHLGSLEPTILTEEFVSRLKSLNVCRHFHVSLQSGCDETLSRMRRKYTSAFYARAVALLRQAFPGCSLTTDLICGFPGETDAEFSASLAFAEACAFAAVHVFPYSRRPGTAAAGMPRQIPGKVKTLRVQKAQRLADRLRQNYLRSCVGETIPVIFETEKDGLCFGHGDNYTEVCVPARALRSDLRSVRITGVDGRRLTGVLL